MYKPKQPKIVAVIQRLPQEPPSESAEPKHSDKSMLGFYANRLGRSSSAADRAQLEKAKAALQVRPDKPVKQE